MCTNLVKAVWPSVIENGGTGSRYCAILVYGISVVWGHF